MSYALQNQIKAMQARINELLERVRILEEAQRPQRPVLTLKKPEKASNVQS